MIKKHFPINILLILSFFFGAFGVYMAEKAYHKNLCILAASSQLEFFKTIPDLVASNESLKIPIYTSIPFLAENRDITGISEGAFYNNIPSIRQASVTTAYRNRDQVRLVILLDARDRR